MKNDKQGLCKMKDFNHLRVASDKVEQERAEEISLDEAVAKYLLAITGEVQPTTVNWYRSHLKSFAADVGGMTKVRTLTVDELRAWRACVFSRKILYDEHPFHPQKEKGLSHFTIHGKLRALKAFFNWLENEGYIHHNPATALRLPKLPKNAPKDISDEDLLKILAAASGNARDYAIIMVLADTGARVGGLVNLTMDDVDLENKTLMVREKGQKTRAVYLTDETIRSLRAYLEKHPQTTTSVFVGRGGKGLTTTGFYQVLRRWAERAAIQGRFNPHSFRHGFARALLKNGASLETVSELMGHGGVKVTADNYAVWTKPELKERHARFSRIANLKQNEEKEE